MSGNASIGSRPRWPRSTSDSPCSKAQRRTGRRLSAPLELDVGDRHASRAREPCARGRSRRASSCPSLGRTFIVFGGAFLLRALTECEPPATRGGHRARPALRARVDRRGRSRRGARRGAQRVVPRGRGDRHRPAHPLGGDDPFPVPGALVGDGHRRHCSSGPRYLVAWLRGIQSLAGLATVGGLITIVGLVMMVGGIVPATFTLILLGFVTLWLGYDRDWHWMRWPAAMAANLAVLETRHARRARRGKPEPVVDGHRAAVAAAGRLSDDVRDPHARQGSPGDSRSRSSRRSCVLLVGLGGAVCGGAAGRHRRRRARRRWASRSAPAVTAPPSRSSIVDRGSARTSTSTRRSRWC